VKTNGMIKVNMLALRYIISINTEIKTAQLKVDYKWWYWVDWWRSLIDWLWHFVCYLRELFLKRGISEKFATDWFSRFHLKMDRIFKRRKDDENSLVFIGIINLHIDDLFLLIFNLDVTVPSLMVKFYYFLNFILAVFIHTDPGFSVINWNAIIEIRIVPCCRFHPNLFRSVTGKTVLLLQLMQPLHFNYDHVFSHF
jgi:hypothetical protein